MAELFRLRVASGKVVIPSRLMSRLQLREGDELRILIGDDNSLSLTTAKDVEREEPTSREVRDLEDRRKDVVSRDAFKKFMSKLSSKTSTPSVKTQSANR